MPQENNDVVGSVPVEVTENILKNKSEEKTNSSHQYLFSSHATIQNGTSKLQSLLGVLQMGSGKTQIISDILQRLKSSQETIKVMLLTNKVHLKNELQALVDDLDINLLEDSMEEFLYDDHLTKLSVLVTTYQSIGSKEKKIPEKLKKSFSLVIADEFAFKMDMSDNSMKNSFSKQIEPFLLENHHNCAIVTLTGTYDENKVIKMKEFFDMCVESNGHHQFDEVFSSALPSIWEQHVFTKKSTQQFSEETKKKCNDILKHLGLWGDIEKLNFQKSETESFAYQKICADIVTCSGLGPQNYINSVGHYGRLFGLQDAAAYMVLSDKDTGVKPDQEDGETCKLLGNATAMKMFLKPMPKFYNVLNGLEKLTIISFYQNYRNSSYFMWQIAPEKIVLGIEQKNPIFGKKFGNVALLPNPCENLRHVAKKTCSNCIAAACALAVKPSLIKRPKNPFLIDSDYSTLEATIKEMKDELSDCERSCKRAKIASRLQDVVVPYAPLLVFHEKTLLESVVKGYANTVSATSEDSEVLSRIGPRVSLTSKTPGVNLLYETVEGKKNYNSILDTAANKISSLHVTSVAAEGGNYGKFDMFLFSEWGTIMRPQLIGRANRTVKTPVTVFKDKSKNVAFETVYDAIEFCKNCKAERSGVEYEQISGMIPNELRKKLGIPKKIPKISIRRPGKSSVIDVKKKPKKGENSINLDFESLKTSCLNKFEPKFSSVLQTFLHDFKNTDDTDNMKGGLAFFIHVLCALGTMEPKVTIQKLQKVSAQEIESPSIFVFGDQQYLTKWNRIDKKFTEKMDPYVRKLIFAKVFLPSKDFEKPEMDLNKFNNNENLSDWFSFNNEEINVLKTSIQQCTNISSLLKPKETALLSFQSPLPQAYRVVKMLGGKFKVKDMPDIQNPPKDLKCCSKRTRLDIESDQKKKIKLQQNLMTHTLALTSRVHRTKTFFEMAQKTINEVLYKPDHFTIRCGAMHPFLENTTPPHNTPSVPEALRGSDVLKHTENYATLYPRDDVAVVEGFLGFGPFLQDEKESLFEKHTMMENLVVKIKSSEGYNIFVSREANAYYAVMSNDTFRKELLKKRNKGLDLDSYILAVGAERQQMDLVFQPVSCALLFNKKSTDRFHQCVKKPRVYVLKNGNTPLLGRPAVFSRNNITYVPWSLKAFKICQEISKKPKGVPDIGVGGGCGIVGKNYVARHCKAIQLHHHSDVSKWSVCSEGNQKMICTINFEETINQFKQTLQKMEIVQCLKTSDDDCLPICGMGDSETGVGSEQTFAILGLSHVPQQEKIKATEFTSRGQKLLPGLPCYPRPEGKDIFNPHLNPVVVLKELLKIQNKDLVQFERNIMQADTNIFDPLVLILTKKNNSNNLSVKKSFSKNRGLGTYWCIRLEDITENRLWHLHNEIDIDYYPLTAQSANEKCKTVFETLNDKETLWLTSCPHFSGKETDHAVFKAEKHEQKVQVQFWRKGRLSFRNSYACYVYKQNTGSKEIVEQQGARATVFVLGKGQHNNIKLGFPQLNVLNLLRPLHDGQTPLRDRVAGAVKSLGLDARTQFSSGTYAVLELPEYDTDKEIGINGCPTSCEPVVDLCPLNPKQRNEKMRSVPAVYVGAANPYDLSVDFDYFKTRMLKWLVRKSKKVGQFLNLKIENFIFEDPTLKNMVQETICSDF